MQKKDLQWPRFSLMTFMKQFHHPGLFGAALELRRCMADAVLTEFLPRGAFYRFRIRVGLDVHCRVFAIAVYGNTACQQPMMYSSTAKGRSGMKAIRIFLGIFKLIARLPEEALMSV